jgi:hypothetical protein
MRTPTFLLSTAVLAAATLPAFAAPPAVGSDHRFEDPVFRGTIFCDTLEQVRHIATLADAAGSSRTTRTRASASPSSRRGL